ncbi:hypothetical protein ACC696_38005, partial [Rhizobium ruizarguesonis]
MSLIVMPFLVSAMRRIMSPVVAAFSSKQIEAAGIWYPLIDTIKLRVPDMKEMVSNQDFFPQTSFINTFVARNEIV